MIVGKATLRRPRFAACCAILTRSTPADPVSSAFVFFLQRLQRASDNAAKAKAKRELVEKKWRQIEDES